MNRDLGTYHVRVELADGRGYILKWNTGPRFCSGNGHVHPLDAGFILPVWGSEEHLIGTIVFQLTENYCDCNFNQDIDHAYQVERDDDFDYPCGDDISVFRLTLIRPDLSETVIYTAI